MAAGIFLVHKIYKVLATFVDMQTDIAGEIFLKNWKHLKIAYQYCVFISATIISCKKTGWTAKK